MNKEKARQILATWLVSSKGTKEQRGYIEGWFDEEDKEAFLMAIEALSDPQICEGCKYEEVWSEACEKCSRPIVDNYVPKESDK